MFSLKDEKDKGDDKDDDKDKDISLCDKEKEKIINKKESDMNSKDELINDGKNENKDK